MVGRIGQQLDQGDTEVRGCTLAPAGDQLTQPVEHQPPETGVVLGEIVDVRWGLGLLRAYPLRPAVEFTWAFDLEAELHRRRSRIEVDRRPWIVWRAYQPQ